MKKILLSLLICLSIFQVKSQCNELFISEYIEGSGNNKVIEIYNPTNFNIPLTGLYSIRMYFNGSITPTSIALTGTINANSTYVLSHALASAPILAIANQTFGSPMFNGDDAVELVRLLPTLTPVDVIGVIGIDPGTEWTLNGASGTADHTLIRMPAIQQGTTTWTGVGEMQWNIFPIDNIANLGAHTMNACALPQPTASIIMGDTCLGMPSLFAANVTGGTPTYNYFWNFGDGSPVDNNAFGTHTYATSGTFLVQLIVVDQNLQDDTAYATITIHPNPVAAFTTSGNTANGCDPDTIQFTNTSTGATSYNWSFGDASTSTLMNPADKVYPAGGYLVTLIVTGPGGCFDSANDSVFVNSLPNVTIQTGDSTICNSSFGIILNASGSTGTWSGLNVSNTGNGVGFFSSAAISAGTYYAVYTINNICGFDKDSIAITVEADPVASYTYAVTGGGFTINFTNTSTGATTYSWDFDGLGNSAATNPSFTFPSNGSYDVCLSAYSTTGVCVNVDCQSIVIVSVDELNLNTFSIFPNPSNNGLFTIEWIKSNQGNLRVLDLAGKLIFEMPIQSSNKQLLDLSNLPAGSYSIEWITNEGRNNKLVQIIK